MVRENCTKLVSQGWDELPKYSALGAYKSCCWFPASFTEHNKHETAETAKTPSACSWTKGNMNPWIWVVPLRWSPTRTSWGDSHHSCLVIWRSIFDPCTILEAGFLYQLAASIGVIWTDLCLRDLRTKLVSFAERNPKEHWPQVRTLLQYHTTLDVQASREVDCDLHGNSVASRPIDRCANTWKHGCTWKFSCLIDVETHVKTRLYPAQCIPQNTTLLSRRVVDVAQLCMDVRQLAQMLNSLRVAPNPTNHKGVKHQTRKNIQLRSTESAY